MNVTKQLHWFIYGLFFLSCARQTTPTGGPKDSIPPIIVNSKPTPEQTNYTDPSVHLTFNETVILNNPKEQIIITPDVGKDFDAEIKKNTVILRFKQDLQENTTYTLNFRESVQDITEKNPVRNLKLAFSTGDYIDSLSISGTVYDAQKSTFIKEATVAIYESDTFNIFSHRPSYFTKTNEKGNFELENLKPGTYYVYAFDDKNKNLITDSKSEAFGFRSKAINLDTNVTSLTIPIIRLDTRPLVLTSARPTGRLFSIKTSKALASYAIKSDEPVVSSFAPDKAGVNVYNTYSDLDSIPLTFSAHDSVNHQIDTLLFIKFSKRESPKEKFSITNDGFRLIGQKGILKGKLTANKPILSINYDSIFYQIDSATIIKINPEDLTRDTINNSMIIKKEFDKTLLVKKPEPSKPRESNEELQKKTEIKQPTGSRSQKPPAIENLLYIAPRSFVSIELDSSALISTPLKPTTLESTGIIIIDVKTTEQAYIAQLLNRSGIVLESVINSKRTIFEDLDPGDYQIRLIIDVNQNGKWDPGNFFLREEPEEIIFYKNEKGVTNVNLKANWELGPLLITY